MQETRAQLHQVAERHEQLLENQGRGVAYEGYQAFGAPPRSHTLEGYEPLELGGGARSVSGSISHRGSISGRSERSEPEGRSPGRS